MVDQGSMEGVTFRFEAQVPSAHFRWYLAEDFYEEVVGSPDPYPQYNIWRKSNLLIDKRSEVVMTHVPGDPGKPLRPPLLVNIGKPVHIYMMGNFFDLNVLDGAGVSISTTAKNIHSSEGDRLEAIYRLLDSFCRYFRPVYGVGYFFRPKDWYWSVDETNAPREQDLSYISCDLNEGPPDTLDRMKKRIAIQPGQFQLEVLDNGQAIMRRMDEHRIVDDTRGGT